ASILERWHAEGTFQATIDARAGGPSYVFYDGPPSATGLPHYGHILTSFIKDIVPRYYTMRGYYVPRRWGWDCHGLPVEFELEQELAFRSPTDPAASVRFRLAADPSQALIAWTTTPWTLPSNVALAVGPEIEYVRLAQGDESVWLARAAVQRYARELKQYTEVETALGR